MKRFCLFLALFTVAAIAHCAESKPIPGVPPTITPNAPREQFHNPGNRWSDQRSEWIDSAAWVRTTGTQRRSAYRKFSSKR